MSVTKQDSNIFEKRERELLWFFFCFLCWGLMDMSRREKKVQWREKEKGAAKWVYVKEEKEYEERHRNGTKKMRRLLTDNTTTRSSSSASEWHTYTHIDANRVPRCFAHMFDYINGCIAVETLANVSNIYLFILAINRPIYYRSDTSFLIWNVLDHKYQFL